MVHIYMFQPLTGHHHQVQKSNTSSVYEYCVIVSGYDENRLTKQNHSTLHLQGKLLNRTPNYKYTFLHNLSDHPNLAACTGDGQKIMETALKDTHFLIKMELFINMPVIQLVSFLEQTQVNSE